MENRQIAENKWITHTILYSRHLVRRIHLDRELYAVNPVYKAKRVPQIPSYLSSIRKLRKRHNIQKHKLRSLSFTDFDYDFARIVIVSSLRYCISVY